MNPPTHPVIEAAIYSDSQVSIHSNHRRCPATFRQAGKNGGGGVNFNEFFTMCKKRELAELPRIRLLVLLFSLFQGCSYLEFDCL